MGGSEKGKLAKPKGKREKEKEWWLLLASNSTVIGNQNARTHERTHERTEPKQFPGWTHPPISDIPDSHMAPCR